MISDDNNVTMDTFCHYPTTANTQGKNAIAIFTGERLNTLDMLAEALKVLTLDSTINDSVYYNSDKDDVESDRKTIHW